MGVRAVSGGTAARAVDRRAVVGGVIFAAVLALFLTQTRLPAVVEKLPTLERGASASGRSAFSQVLDPLAFPEGLRWVAYGVNLWDANAVGMFFAVLLGGAAMTAVAPAARMTALLRRRGAIGAGLGGGMGLPLFMCSACSAPVSLGFHRAGAALETTLGIILGSALFNPVGIAAIFALMPVELGVVRLAFGLLLLFALVPVIGRLHDRVSPPAAPGEVAARQALEDAVGGVPAWSQVPSTDGWPAAVGDGLRAWWRATTDHAVRLVPPMAVAGFAVGAVFAVVPPQELSDTVGSGTLAIVVAAAVGTLLQLPTLFEPAAATAVLLTAPSAGVVTFALTRKALGWRAPALLLAGTFAGGVTGGLVVGAL
jgi:uncharacterized membrane protein YraQ (UPF0718 family)